MASIHNRSRADGTVVYQVKWRENGRPRSATTATRAAAKRIKGSVEATGTWREDMTRDEPTVEEWAAHYLEHSTRANDDTVEGYRRTVAKHITPALGELSLSAVTPDVVRVWVKGLHMADKTRHNVVSLLSGIMTTAVQAGHLASNPVQSIRLPRTDPPADRKIITTAELAVILFEIPDHYKPLVATLAGTGLRWGEAAGLNVADVDLGADPPHIRVTKAVKHRAKQGDEPGQPKTRRSVRKVSIPQQVIPALAPLLHRPLSTPLFVNSVGQRVRDSTFRGSVWYPALDRAQDRERHGDMALPHRPRVHDLRAFATTWLIEEGVPIGEVADQLGHESVTTTFGIYRRINPESGRRVAAAMGAVFDKVSAHAIES